MKLSPSRQFILTLMSGILCWLTIEPASAKEPMYQGKALSEWLAQFEKTPTTFEAELEQAGQGNLDEEAEKQAYERQHAQALNAIRQIGTNGLPILLNLVNVDAENWRSVLKKVKSKDFKAGLRSNEYNQHQAIREAAVDAFGILGSNATPAIPELTRLLHNKTGCPVEVAYALSQMGPQGFAVLTNDINSGMVWAEYAVPAIAEKSGSDVLTITRFLITALKSPDPIVRGSAAMYLGGKDAALAVPALISTLDDRDSYPQEQAAMALGNYGQAAKEAVPKLLSLYTNSLNDSVLSALKQIDLEAASKAETYLLNSGPLNSKRSGYTRTLLRNGNELIAGGFIDTAIVIITNRYLSRSELLDSKSGEWTETGKMTTPREQHVACLLLDGRVLVAGGRDRHLHELSSAEIYDPTTGTWTETGAMNTARSVCHALLQSNGKVLVFSGVGSDTSPAINKELYDPATGTWKKIPAEPAFDKALYNDDKRSWKIPPHHKDYE